MVLFLAMRTRAVFLSAGHLLPHAMQFASLHSPRSGTFHSKVTPAEYTLAEQHSGVENIFVDRSADLFQYMLAFHRDRKIIIPHTVPKESVLREAAVFGLPVSTNDIIQETPPLAQLGTIVSDVAEVVEESLVASKVALLSDLILKGHELLAIWPEPHVKKRRMSIA
jgi:hypothetical protein